MVLRSVSAAFIRKLFGSQVMMDCLRLLCLVTGILFGGQVLAEPFVSGGAIGSQTSDGFGNLGPVVEQPIEFPHDTHAGTMGINCLYCHSYGRRSAVAGIPRLNKCIGCHQGIPSVADKPRIKKLMEYWEKKEAIPWKKVHDLPDFVRFNHERHVQRFYVKQDRPIKEACGYCHGDVSSMTVARRVKSLTMGWCVSCHEKEHKDDAIGQKAGSNGPGDCWACHK
ncbi:cytochrome c3 family protein [Leptothrix ochracea]|uniref:cytochrome c3 family protein n=1 Tax=Leptothrix ochracea TaxID=735331 RepID=UPI0034E2A448